MASATNYCPRSVKLSNIFSFLIICKKLFLKIWSCWVPAAFETTKFNWSGHTGRTKAVWSWHSGQVCTEFILICRWKGTIWKSWPKCYRASKSSKFSSVCFYSLWRSLLARFPLGWCLMAQRSVMITVTVCFSLLPL